MQFICQFTTKEAKDIAKSEYLNKCRDFLPNFYKNIYTSYNVCIIIFL